MYVMDTSINLVYGHKKNRTNDWIIYRVSHTLIRLAKSGLYAGVSWTSIFLLSD